MTKKEIKTTCIDWVKSSSFIGLPNIFNEKSIIIRLLWLSFFLISLTLFLVQSIQQIQEFFLYKVNRQINIFSPQVPVSFPIVAICNINFLSTQYAALFAHETISAYLNNSLANNTILLQNVLVQKNLVQANAKIQNETVQRQFGLFGSKAPKSIITCLFDGKPCDLKNDFDWYFDSKYGNCFKFNSKQTKQVSQTGAKTGLYIELFIGDEDELVSFTRNRGIHLFITNDSFIDPSADGFDISPGMSTDIIMRYSLIKRLSDPYSRCEKKDLYSQNDCSQTCYQENIIQNCSCYDTRFSSNSFQFQQQKNRPCIEINDFLCSSKFLKEFGKTAEKQACDLKCPIECKTDKYEQKLSFSEFPSESYAIYLMKMNNFTSRSIGSQMNYSRLKKSTAAFDLYYDDFIFNSIEDVPAMSFNDLTSNIGGNLALYIGISLVSLCQFLEIFIKLIIIFFKNHSSSKKNEEIRL